MHCELLGTSSIKKKRSTRILCKQTHKICTNKGRGVPFPVASVVSSICCGDLLLFAWGTDVLEEVGALDERMSILLIVLCWPSVGGGEADPRRRRTA